jgi:predicted oxidoreductase
LGRALKDFARRDEVVIATKIFYPVRPDPNGRGLSRKAIFAGIDASLHRLGTNFVDLYQIHRWDEATLIEETLEALHDVVCEFSLKLSAFLLQGLALLQPDNSDRTLAFGDSADRRTGRAYLFPPNRILPQGC